MVPPFFCTISNTHTHTHAPEGDTVSISPFRRRNHCLLSPMLTIKGKVGNRLVSLSVEKSAHEGEPISNSPPRKEQRERKKERKKEKKSKRSYSISPPRGRTERKKEGKKVRLEKERGKERLPFKAN